MKGINKMLNNLNISTTNKLKKYDTVLLFLCKECVEFLQDNFLPESGKEILHAFFSKDKTFFKVGSINKLTFIEKKELKQIIIAGCGEGKECTSTNFRKVAGEAVRFLNQSNAKDVFLTAPIIMNEKNSRYLEAITQGLYLGAYNYDEYKSTKKKINIISINILTKVQFSTAIIKKAIIMCEAVSFARDLINKPGNEIYPQIMANYAKKIAKDNKLQIEILDEKKLVTNKMNAILAVGQGSVHQPRMIVLKYKGNGSAPYTAYVGKGITFDSGGISIKSSEGMGEMKDDMSGAADVLATMYAVSKLKLKVNLIAILSCAENMPSGNAQRPGDIVRSASGKTIEVITTDAEGRMVLADAVWYACKLGAKKVIDIATLTGAVIIALGNETAGIISNNDDLTQKVIQSGKFVGESYWQLPTYQEYKELIKSSVADLKNSGGRAGGCITGGLFIGEFIAKDVQWVHLDIGGTASATKTCGFKPQGGTAFGVMTLIKLAEQL